MQDQESIKGRLRVGWQIPVDVAVQLKILCFSIDLRVCQDLPHAHVGFAHSVPAGETCKD